MLIDPFVKKPHEWTAAPIPWDMPDSDSADSDDAGHLHLFRLLGGGALRSFHTASRELLRERRQDRFLVFAAAILVLWLVFLFI